MIELRVPRSDGELEAWRQVRIAVVPGERAPTVEELRAVATPERLMLLALHDGDPVGAGVADRSEMAGRASLLVRVVPAARRRGVGSALLRSLAAHVASLGYDHVGSRTEDDDALPFALRFGFREVDRDVEQVYAVGDEPPARAPDGVEIVAVAERPELWDAVYATVAQQAFRDMALDTPLDVPLDVWRRDWISDPSGMFVAVANGEPIGVAGLMLDADVPDRAENALTAVRRDWRGRGVASALKQAALHWAAANGLREVYTWTQDGNEGMRRVNERLGYAYRSESVRLRAPLPLS